MPTAPRPGAPTDRTKTVSVVADDPVTGEGVVTALAGRPGLTLLPAHERPRADVLLVLTTEVTEESLRTMETLAARSANPATRIVLVTDVLREHQVMRGVQCGVRAVLWRGETGVEAVAEAVHAVAGGRADFPPVVQGWLADQIHAVRRDVLAPLGLTTTGLDTREVEVLRLLADGLDSAEIAERLNYSVRTIKNIVSGAMTRLGMRNRTQTVAHAIRSGAV
jgi:DNA-binding NarL/FixJ family response regulator